MWGKRRLSISTMRKRGCVYCADLIGNTYCKYRKCPYNDLDEVRSYGEYLQSLADIKIPTIPRL